MTHLDPFVRDRLVDSKPSNIIKISILRTPVVILIGFVYMFPFLDFLGFSFYYVNLKLNLRVLRLFSVCGGDEEMIEIG